MSGHHFGPKSIQIIVRSFKNLTSGVVFPAKPGKSLPEDIGITFIEHQEEEFMLELPRNSCVSGHHIGFSLYTEGAEKNLSLTATGVCLKHETVDANFDQITVKLVQYNREDLLTLRAILEERQASVQNLLEAMKGL